MVAEAPARHDLVWLAPGWPRALVTPLAPRMRAPLAAWVHGGRPLVACRRDAAMAEAVALGLALPPRDGARRVSVAVRPEAIARTAPPLSLAEALASAPMPWRARLGALDRDARAAGLVLRVYGSLAWQHLSGATYVRAGSDVDLVVRVCGPRELRGALELLRPRAHEGAPRLDGEIVLPGERAVAWRELAARPARILVKSRASVALERLEDALGSLAEALA